MNLKVYLNMSANPEECFSFKKHSRFSFKKRGCLFMCSGASLVGAISAEGKA